MRRRPEWKLVLRPANTMDALTAITARSNVHSGLARCVEALSGGTLTINRQLADLGSAWASLLGVRGQHTNKRIGPERRRVIRDGQVAPH